MRQNKQYDIAVVGGGIVGLTFAVLAAQAGFSLVILDKNSLLASANLEPYDTRVSAISRASENIFRSINIWSQLEEIRVSPYRKMEVYQETSQHHLDFNAHEVAEINLGHIIENKIMLYALQKKIQEFPHIDLVMENDSLHFNVGLKEVEITSDSAKITAKLMVGADGSDSYIRSSLSLPTFKKSYEQTAMVANIEIEKPHAQTAYQIFLKDSILAFLPFKEQHLCSIVWSMECSRAKAMSALAKDKFEALLADAFKNKFGHIKLDSPINVFPLKRQYSSQYIANRTALIGDAIHVVHPLAGQGLNLGLGDAKKLAEILSIAKSKQQDIGLHHILRIFERNRKFENQTMLFGMDFLKYFYNQNNLLLRPLRTLGLSFLDYCQPVKNLFIKTAMGTNN